MKIHVLDSLFVLIFICFAVKTYRCGFVYEVFSKFRWIGGVIIAFVFTPFFAFTYVRSFTGIEFEPILYFVAFVVLFILSFSVIHFIALLVGPLFELPVINRIDRFLGVLLGLVEAFILCAIILELLLIQPFWEQKVWMGNSKLAPLFIQYILKLESCL